jgi:hypothetical protein
MDIAATIFYILGSIYMLLGICLMIGVAVLAWKLYQTAKQTQQKVESVVSNLPEKIVQTISSRPGLLAGTLGMGLSTFLMKKVQNMFNKK